MLAYYEAMTEFTDYLSTLPESDTQTIYNRVIKIHESRGHEERFEEIGSFQFYDRTGMTLWNGDYAREMEENLNDMLQKDGYSIRANVQRIDLSVHPYSLFKCPTTTFEIVVIDNVESEAQDTIWQKLIENRQELI